MGAGGRDFHDFAAAMRDDPEREVVAFTATQIPFIADRRYPASLAGPRYPDGIPVVDEAELPGLLAAGDIDEVVFSYSDRSHVEVMHAASLVLSAGADFRLLGSVATTLGSPVPVVAVCATRTGAGKSPVSRRVAAVLATSGRRVGLIRHPMPYGDLAAMAVQRFATVANIDAAAPTIEEREEYELPVAAGLLVYAGVDYRAIVDLAAAECDVLIWDGGNNDTPFVWPDLHLTVVDALRPADGLAYHPGEVNLRRADVVVVNKVGGASEAALAEIDASLAVANPAAEVVRAESVVTLDDGPDLRGRRVVVVEDGPTTTHGGMASGAGLVAARAAGAVVVDPRPFAAGSLATTYEAFPHLGPVLPAMGYSDAQVADLEATLAAVDADAVVCGTPFDLGRVVRSRHPIRRVTYEVREVGEPDLATVVGERMARWDRGERTGAAAHR